MEKKGELVALNNSEKNWAVVVLQETLAEPRRSAITPKRDRIWVYSRSRFRSATGLAVTFKRRSPLRKLARRISRLKTNIVEMKKIRVRPLCGFYDNFDDDVSLELIRVGVNKAVAQGYSSFLKSERGIKLFKVKLS